MLPSTLPSELKQESSAIRKRTTHCARGAAKTAVQCRGRGRSRFMGRARAGEPLALRFKSCVPHPPFLLDLLTEPPGTEGSASQPGEGISTKTLENKFFADGTVGKAATTASASSPSSWNEAWRTRLRAGRGGDRSMLTICFCEGAVGKAIAQFPEGVCTMVRLAGAAFSDAAAAADGPACEFRGALGAGSAAAAELLPPHPIARERGHSPRFFSAAMRLRIFFL